MSDMTQFEMIALVFLFCIAFGLVIVSKDLSNILLSLRNIDGNIDKIADDINNRQEDIYGDDDD